MKKVTSLVLVLFTAIAVSSCCCQDRGAPAMKKMPKFNDLGQPVEVYVGKGKGKNWK